MVGPAAAMALPVAGIPQNDPRSAAGFPVSPFALPMPEFGAPFPSFETGVPSIPALPPMITEEDARSVLTAPSAFYFLEHAGGLGGSEMAPKQASAPTDLSSRPELRRSVVEGPAVSTPSLSSPFSLPMPEFDQALFPSFDASVPKLPQLPSLGNEDDARAALTRSKSTRLNSSHSS